HAARLRDGLPVVVKVQRPHIRNALSDDVEFFRELATFLSEHTSAGQRMDMIGVVQQLERALTDELDYRIEARNAAMFRRSLAEFPRIPRGPGPPIAAAGPDPSTLRWRASKPRRNGTRFCRRRTWT